MRRITLSSPALADFPAHLPASYIKLIFPEAGQNEPVALVPDGPRPTNMRTYTPLHVDAQAATLDVDFVLHGEGPAGLWAAQAAVGQKLYLMGPGPGYKFDAEASHHLLLGDDSALPAMEAILASLPATAKVDAVMEVLDAQEERALTGPSGMQVHWLHRGHDNTTAGQPMEAALRAKPQWLLDHVAAGRVYLACEAAAMRRLRSLLVDELGFTRQQVVGRGYWKLGVGNHPDHDYGEDA